MDPIYPTTMSPEVAQPVGKVPVMQQAGSHNSLSHPDIGSRVNLIKQKLSTSGTTTNGKVNIEGVNTGLILPDGESNPDRYLLLEQLGSGGLGTVWKTQDRATNQTVAVKFLKSGSHPQEDIKRFIREASGLSKVDHPNVVRVFDIASSDRYGPYLVMEHLEGFTLDVKVNSRRNSGPYKLTKAEKLEFLDLLIKVTDALHAIHKNKVIHRDLKSSNIIITPRGPVIIDFGLAKVDGASTITQNRILGTPAYMPPEQIDDSSHIDFRADLYSLGVILYETFTGTNPFSSNNAAVAIKRQSDVVPKEPIEIEGTTPIALNVLITRLLHKVPDHRPGSAQEVRDTLADIKRSLSRTGSQQAGFARSLAVI